MEIILRQNQGWKSEKNNGPRRNDEGQGLNDVGQGLNDEGQGL